MDLGKLCSAESISISPKKKIFNHISVMSLQHFCNTLAFPVALCEIHLVLYEMHSPVVFVPNKMACFCLCVESIFRANWPDFILFLSGWNSSSCSNNVFKTSQSWGWTYQCEHCHIVACNRTLFLWLRSKKCWQWMCVVFFPSECAFSLMPLLNFSSCLLTHWTQYQKPPSHRMWRLLLWRL